MITVTAISTNYSEIPTGEIDMPVAEFAHKNALVDNGDGTYSAEWGDGEGADVFEIVSSLDPIEDARQKWENATHAWKGYQEKMTSTDWRTPEYKQYEIAKNAAFNESNALFKTLMALLLEKLKKAE